MRLKRRLMVVVRLVTDSAQCKPGALFPQGAIQKKTPEKLDVVFNWSKFVSPRIADN